MSQTARFADLEGRPVFLTGGASGIGAALVEGFLAQGCPVAFADIKAEAGQALAERLGREQGARPLFLDCDLTDVAALKTAMAKAEQAHGPTRILVNNAANDQRHRTEGCTVAQWDAGQALNLRPHFFAAQAAVPGMRAAGGGAIINFSSVAYMMGNAGFPGYLAAKSGITGLTRGLAREFGPDRIRVNAVMPGWVLTERQMKLWASPEDLKAHLDRQCLKEHLMPADLVEPVLFLASDASRMMTGQALVVDGGVVTTG